MVMFAQKLGDYTSDDIVCSENVPVCWEIPHIVG